MFVQLRLLLEGFLAFRALERLHSRVSPQVVDHVTLLVELLLAVNMPTDQHSI